MTTRRRWIYLAWLSVVAAGGCASGSGGSGGTEAAGGGDGQTAIVIDHRNSAITSATIYLEPVSGRSRQVLGIVAFGDQRTFPVEISSSATYKLVAEGGPDPMETREFILRPGDVIEWDLFTTNVRRR